MHFGKWEWLLLADHYRPTKVFTYVFYCLLATQNIVVLYFGRVVGHTLHLSLCVCVVKDKKIIDTLGDCPRNFRAIGVY